jgi:hypothetical protein
VATRGCGHYLIVEATLELFSVAGGLAERYRLRGCDGIQLATFLEVAREDAMSETRFSSLNHAANAALWAAPRPG